MPLRHQRHREALERLTEHFAGQLQPGILSELREYARVGEYGVGFELLCNMLFEYSVTLSRATFAEIEAFGTDLNLARSRWTYLEPLIAGDPSESSDAKQRIRYSDECTDVLIGDRVRVRLFFFIRRTGRITYVPGISALHREMEHDGIKNVGITFDGGGAGGFFFDPDTRILSKAVTFLDRDSSPAPELPREEDWR